jgi:hypothetical protein
MVVASKYVNPECAVNCWDEIVGEFIQERVGLKIA